MDAILQANIIKDLGLDQLPKKEQEETLLIIGRIIFQSVLIRVMEELSDKDKDEFEKVLTEKPNDEKAILGFLKSKIANLDAIVNEEIVKLKQESIGLMSNVGK